MSQNKLLPCGALVVGSLIVFIGTVFVLIYVLEAVIARVGEADQSLLFWYLPILFIGLFGLVIGATIGVWGYIRLRKAPPSPQITGKKL